MASPISFWASQLSPCCPLYAIASWDAITMVRNHSNTSYTPLNVVTTQKAKHKFHVPRIDPDRPMMLVDARSINHPNKKCTKRS